MSLRELLRLALSRLRTSRLRAALTMLGVIIGVASVVALVGVGQGTTSNITSRLAGLGTNLLTISPTGGGGSTSHADPRRRDAIAELPTSPASRPRSRPARSSSPARTSTTTTVIGTTAAYPTRPRLRRLAGHVPDRRQRRPATCASPSSARRRRRTSASAPSDIGTRDHDRRPAVPGHRHPPAQGRHRLPGSRRPGPRADRRRAEVLRRRRHASGRSASASPRPTR